MTATTLVKDVLDRVSVLLQDRVPQYQRWPEREQINYLNDAQMAIVKYAPSVCSRVDAIKLKPGTRQSIETIAFADCKPGDGTTPTVNITGKQFLSVMRNMGSNGATPGKVIRLTRRDIMDSQQPNWHMVPGAAVASLMYDPLTPRYFYVTPGVQATGGDVWIEIAYTADPIKIAAGGVPGAELYSFDTSISPTPSTVVISIPDEFVEDIVNYIVARCHMKQMAGADKTVASAFAQMFLTSINAKVAAITGNNPNLTFLPFAAEPLPAAK